MPKPPGSRGGERSEPCAETNRPRLAWSRTRAPAPVQLAGCRRSWLPHRASAAAGAQSRRCPYSRPGSFPLCYTAGRHEGARREARVELMKEPADRAVLLLQRVGELLLESRAIVKELEAVCDGKSSADAA